MSDTVYLSTLQFSWGGLFDSQPADGKAHLVRGTTTGTPGPTLCGIDRFNKDGPGWSVGGGVSGPSISHTPCDGCVAEARETYPGLPIAGLGAVGVAEQLNTRHYGHSADIRYPAKEGPVEEGVKMASLTFANITNAAKAQNWDVERTAKGHRRLIPPDKTKPIVIASGTTGDPKAIKHFLSQMRLSGLIWPPPPPVRNHREEHTEITVDETVIEEARRLNLGDIPGLDDDEVQDQWIPVVADRPIAPGYVMNIDGEVRSPIGNVLMPEQKGLQLWIGFKPLGAVGYVTKRSRLDKVVLLTWVGEPVDPDARAMHINGDALDCRPDNLRWPCDVKPVAVEPVESAWRPSEAATTNGTAPSQHFDEAVPQLGETQEEVNIHSNEGITEREAHKERDADDDVSVKFVLSNRNQSIDLVGAFTATGAFGDYSITTDGRGQLEGLSGDDLKAIAAIIARWRKVADQL